MSDKETIMNQFNFKFHEIARLYRSRFQMLVNEAGMHPGQPPILLILLKEKDCTQKELCKLIHIKPASMTDILQRMERDELIIRKQDTTDMRATKVCLSKKGIEKVQSVFSIGKQIEKDCFFNFSKEEKETFSLLMDKIYQNLYSILNESEKRL